MTRPAPRWAVMVASVGGTGHARRAPGTVGSLLALPFGVLLLRRPVVLLAGSLLVSAGGVVAIRHASNGVDHGWIVIDEVAGMWITLGGLAALPGLPAPRGRRLRMGVLTAFAFFRLLDIGKPGLIGTIDRRDDALGVMGDDMLAGITGAVLLLAGRIGSRWIGSGRMT